MMGFSGLFGINTRQLGSGLFSPVLDLRGDDPSPPSAIFLAAENSDLLLTEFGNNFVVE